MAPKERKFDTRTIDRFVRDGQVSEAEYQKYLDSLPDVADKATPLEAQFVQGVLDDDGEDSAEK